MPKVLNDKKYDLEERTAKFGEDVIRFCKKIPHGPITNPLITQLIKVLQLEKSEEEKSSIFEERLLSEIEKIIEK